NDSHQHQLLFSTYFIIFGGVIQRLTDIKRGQNAKIISLPAGYIKVQAIRLGLTEGITITCKESIPLGPVIVCRNRVCVAIGRELADKIQVEALFDKEKFSEYR
ncbi:MAG: ferrous iron transport protein A, partial [Peptococcaceae bacterium]|nr:ferrous iron transport protein A [Peptococcaceae bacterium]